MNEDIFDQMKALGLVESTELEKEEPQEEKQNKQKKSKKQKPMDITLDPSLDSDNYKKSWNNNPNKSSNKNSNKNKKDTRETLYSHDHYTDNSQAPKAAVSAYNFVPFTRTVLALSLIHI